MHLSNNIQNMAVFIEFLASAGLAIFFHLVLHSPEAAYSIFGVGILISLATYLLREDLKNTRIELLKHYQHAHEITFAVAQITDLECQAKAQDQLDGVKRTIALLQQGFIPLEESEFYLEGAKCSDMACKQLKTVDPMTTAWYSRGALLNFYQSNLRALERGVAITRVFVVNRDDLCDPDNQKVLLAQHRDGIDVRIAFRDELLTVNAISGRDTTSSYDFSIYDSHIVTEVFPQTGKFFGHKTTNPASVEKYLRLYELIEHSAHAVTEENEGIVLDSERLKPGVPPATKSAEAFIDGRK